MNNQITPDALFLVTGGAGFIGSNLCEALLAHGFRVRCLDNLSTGLMRNVEMFLSNPNYEFISGDVCDFATCMKACDSADYVLHQAASENVTQSLREPLLYTHNNVLGTANMLEAARQNGAKKFVYASSAAVYGEFNTLPNREDARACPSSPYAATKLINEIQARQYSSRFRLDTCGLRYFNVFGRKQNPNADCPAVIPSFLKAMLRGKSPTIYGDGRQSRDFIFIDDVIDANIQACRIDSGISGEVFNIANGRQITLLEVCEAINVLLGVELDPKFVAARDGDVKHSQADIGKAHERLGFNPRHDFVAGLKLTIDWYRADWKEWI